MDLEKLVFQSERGWYEPGYMLIPYSIWYDLESETNAIVNEETPGGYGITPDSHEGGESLSIWVHKSVPPELREIVAYHEFEEARLVHGPTGMNSDSDRKLAHDLATQKHIQYLRIFFPTLANEFYEWEEKKEI